MEELRATWPDGLEDELIRELLDNQSPFFLLPEMTTEPAEDAIMNRLISSTSTVYSEPTISEDLEDAFSTTTSKDHQHQELSQPRISALMERGLNKVENKNTLKIKSYSNAMADDGYKWRKYGQKAIKNSPHPRSYYRCTNPRCNAKKQVERSSEDPQTLLITYEGLHLHFAYPHSFIPAESQPINPTIKKAKKTHDQTQQILQELQESSADLTTPPDLQQQQQLFLRTSLDYPQEWDPEGMVVPQGLLEDVVMPFMIPNPLNNNTSPNYSSCSSYPSPPPSPPLFWSCATHSSACFDIGIEH
ncbi:hypothetical protein F2P56_008421 [Juglans regia]|uniref:WRKY domain-containing protein n=3 Tax=Juglans TaxID=16718 RepID=A0A833XV31_JUGRE|nr:probable WRKY transcription factor 49 [Juglans regia]KAF5471646.1 hypothetical protein F2P56_008421 [Juglans regia]QWQ79458.1 WRKY36 [Juglans sigillata]